METALDKWEPRGKPIHPLDLLVVLNNLPLQHCTLLAAEHSPVAIDQADYDRNKHKVGSVIAVAGTLYFETTSVEPMTKAFA